MRGRVPQADMMIIWWGLVGQMTDLSSILHLVCLACFGANIDCSRESLLIFCSKNSHVQNSCLFLRHNHHGIIVNNPLCLKYGEKKTGLGQFSVSFAKYHNFPNLFSICRIKVKYAGLGKIFCIPSILFQTRE